MTATIRNPIIRGCNPDPSILRVGDDYYIATSTFEWMPGIQIHHSRDLANWRLIGHVLTKDTGVDLRGVIDSAGIWAPSLSYHDGLFYIVYTVVRTRVGAFKDVLNYVVTSTGILGPWSEPVFLNASGFDPSLFHDDDGRKWVVNVQWDNRPDRPSFAGIVLQEYDAQARGLIGPIKTILRKECLIEGPNLYKHDGRYYLMLAEGGTGWNHGISMARADSVDGPYECDPATAVLTSRDDAAYPLQKAGHGELVQTQSGAWYLAHLASRPIGQDRRCMLGRETCLQRVVWTDDGWLRLKSGRTAPALQAASVLDECQWDAESTRDDFDAETLGLQWASLRAPVSDDWASLSSRPGWLRLRGRESLHSLFDQSLVARRVEESFAVAETCLEFAPKHFSQSAGLVCWYDTKTHYYLRVTRDEDMGVVIGIAYTDDGQYGELNESRIVADEWDRFYLRAEIEEERLQFFASPDGKTWSRVGPVLDASKLSDDYGAGLHFTGAFIGLCAQDFVGRAAVADFDYFSLKYELAANITRTLRFSHSVTGNSGNLNAVAGAGSFVPGRP
ncbi:MAG: glycoside hydrolase family 43 protein [Capsulimonadaceae bacterium]|nr:glycoside hydrolase family 43 protein [Capsulimonadaceae bacterium]